MAARAKIIAYSIGEHGRAICTISVRYWRAIHGELLTHRMLSRSSSSSRAIPVRRMLKQVWNDPAGPQHWGANRPGMQATEQLTGWRLWAAKKCWHYSARTAAFWSWVMMKLGLHKQVANRVTEPYQYISVVITSTEWDNFFHLRRHGDAQPEMRDLADTMWRAMAAAKPVKLRPGQWHLPWVSDHEVNTWGIKDCLKMSTARSARVSYLNHDLSIPEARKDFKLHDDLVGSDPIHASPTEHAAQVMPDAGHYANFTGFRSYRRCVESGAIIFNGVVQPLEFEPRKRA